MMTKRILAFSCRICPFCICARRWAASRFARFLKKAEKTCPACKAYAELARMNRPENQQTKSIA